MVGYLPEDLTLLHGKADIIVGLLIFNAVAISKVRLGEIDLAGIVRYNTRTLLTATPSVIQGWR